MVNIPHNIQMICYEIVPVHEPEAHVLLLTNVTPTHSVKNKINKNK